MSFADVEGVMKRDPPAVLCIEIGQRMNGGACISWEDLVQVRALCSRHGVWMHMDGARIWEAAPGYGRPVSEIAAQFDSVYVSFYKGLGALSGAALLGPPDAVGNAKLWLKRLGTVQFTYSPYVLSAKRAFREHQSKFPERLANLIRYVEALSAEPLLRNIVRFDPPRPQSSLLHIYVKGDAAALDAAHAKVMEGTSVKLWNRLRGSGHSLKHGIGGEQYFEWNMGPHNAAMPLEDWLAAWRLLAAELSL
jgi:threonine aldolase